MAVLRQLAVKAQACVAASPTPTAVLPVMLAAGLGSQSSFELLQETVDHLTCLAKAGQSFTPEQKEFMHDLFEAFAYGGRILGMPEAAKLAYHYVNGQGANVSLSSAVYENSVIVQDTCAAMAEYMAATLRSRAFGRSNATSTDPAFLHSSQARPLLKKTRLRSSQTQGAILNQGALIAEQNNRRLKNADHRFVLAADAYKTGNNALEISWTVRSKYDFDPFSQASCWTDIPLGLGRTLKLPDGLSEYISQPHIGVARAFEHVASWRTIWTRSGVM